MKNKKKQKWETKRIHIQILEDEVLLSTKHLISQLILLLPASPRGEKLLGQRLLGNAEGVRLFWSFVLLLRICVSVVCLFLLVQHTHKNNIHVMPSGSLGKKILNDELYEGLETNSSGEHEKIKYPNLWPCSNLLQRDLLPSRPPSSYHTSGHNTLKKQTVIWEDGKEDGFTWGVCLTFFSPS